MLKKLMKHEWNALGRLLFPLYGLLLITAPLAGLLNRASMSGMMKIQTGNPHVDSILYYGLSALLILFNFIFFIEIIGIVVANFILVAMRFYKTMTGEEAYLTHTLPVTMRTLIISKTLVASLYEAISSLIVLASAIVYWLCFDKNAQINLIISELGEIFHQLKQLDGNFIIPAIEFILLLTFTLFATNLHIFASVALGHLITKHRVAGSFLMYVLINYAKQFLTLMLTFIYMMLTTRNIENVFEGHSDSFVLSYLFTHFEGIILFITVLTIAILYGITHHVFTKRLNLD